MRKIVQHRIVIFALFVCTNTVFCQVSNFGKPLSWSIAIKSSDVTVVMPTVNVKKMLEEDKISALDKSRPTRFGCEIKTTISTNNNGKWYNLPTGQRIWKVNIISKNAETINLVFDKFYLPKGARVYIYNNERTKLLGAYTQSNNKANKVLGTWPINGDSIWVEYNEPKHTKEQCDLHISKVIHGYRQIPMNGLGKVSKKEISCNYSVNCDIGDDFNEIKDRLKFSVGLVIAQDSYCTGTLINNTNNDKAPYFLTANHCLEDTNLKPATWAFRFNWINKNLNCGELDFEFENEEYHVINGATVLAKNVKSDFLLLKLNEQPKPEWNLEWAGWDTREEVFPKFSVGIHYPVGGFMEICRDNDPPEKSIENFRRNDVDIWRISENKGGWDIGVTEGGSSGSALFNDTGKIIGQLVGGNAFCNETTDSNSDDWYGRFSTSWNYGSTKDTSLKAWLDPKNTGKTYLDMLSLEIIKENQTTEVSVSNQKIFPNPTKEKITITNSIVNQKYQIFDISGNRVLSGKISSDFQINVSFLVSGLYIFNYGGDFLKFIKL